MTPCYGIYSKCVYKILFYLILTLSPRVIVSQGFIGNSDQNPSYYGPSECGHVLLNHYQLFSEYPTNAPSNVNFLSFGDECNYAAEIEFIFEMRDTFLRGTNNNDRMLELKERWERWRSEIDSGRISGRQICNPKRMLECHKILSKCVCRSTLQIFDVANFEAEEQLAIDSVRVNQSIPFTNKTEVVIICKAKVDNACTWNVPWLGFCALPCAELESSTPTYCVGQPNDIFRCRACDPPNDIFGDETGTVNKCFQTYVSSQNDANALFYDVFFFTHLIYIILIIIF